jgi:hypothetical protein
MSRAKAELVKQISAEAFKDAIDLMACLAVLQESESFGEPGDVVAHALAAADASLAATIVRKALLQRVLMTIERAFAPVRYKSDRHARVAFEYLSDPSIFDEVAKAGSREQLGQACFMWHTYDQDARRRRSLRHYRDKVVAHVGERDPMIPVPLVSDLKNYAVGTADALARLAYGSGEVKLQLKEHTDAYDKSAKAFWSVWR